MEAEKIRSDDQFRRCANEFFTEACAAALHDPELFPDSSWGIRVEDGMFFVLNERTAASERNLIARATKLLGSTFGNEQEVRALAWKTLRSGIQSGWDSATFVRQLAVVVGQHAQQVFELICPNWLIRFEGAVRHLVIGPVEAVVSQDLLTSLPRHGKLDVGAADKFSVRVTGGRLKVELSPVSWRVSVRAAKGFAREEAAWLIERAVSLLRLHYNHASPFFPRVGEIETRENEDPRWSDDYLLVQNNVLSAGGLSVRGSYTVDAGVLAITQTAKFKSRCSQVFSGSTKDLSQRFGQGLGWLTRGRTSTDRSERFLFFFTAIESVLSSDDKSAPVVQTIIRFAAVILADDPAERAGIASTIKKLYESRSSLVHQGRRDVQQADVDLVQQIAEALYTAIIDRVSLDMSFLHFQQSLSDASYGTKWQP